MEGYRNEFIKSVERLGRYSEDEAIKEASDLRGLIEGGEAADYSAAERVIAENKIVELIQAGRAMEAIRLKYFTEKTIADDFILEACGNLRRLMEEASDEETYERLAEEWDHVDQWRDNQ